MKHTTKFFAALTACILLASCNSAEPAKTDGITTAEKTTTATETTTAPETTTTAATTTTTARTTTTTTTAAKEPDNIKKYPLNFDPFFPDETGFDLELFERVFYGHWKWNGEEERERILTYSESPFTFENWYYPCGISETDDIYAMPYINGGVLGCIFIEKSAPDVMYARDCWFDTNSNPYVIIDENSIGYTRVPGEVPQMPEQGEISVFGMYILEREYGEDFVRKFDETVELHHQEGITDEDGRVWVQGGDMGLDVERRFLVSRSDSSLTIAMLYRDNEEMMARRHESYSIIPTERYFALTFTRNDSGEWDVTYALFDPQ